MAKRKLAVEYYISKNPCKKCGTFARYKSNKVCPVCHSNRTYKPRVKQDLTGSAARVDPNFDPYKAWRQASIRASKSKLDLMAYLKELDNEDPLNGV